MKSIGPCAALLCAFAASSASALERAEVSPDANPAVLALLETAERDLNAGQPDEAAVVLERALLIEPRNPTVWYYLGLARFDQGNYSQAEAIAAKSHTLASADRSLRVRNAGLMASAQQAAGKRVSVPSSEPPVSALERLFATVVEPARTYAEDVAAQVEANVPAPVWRRVDAGYTRTERQRRERAAWRSATSSQSIIVFDGRQYRRVVPSEGNRRRRY
jgi:tetratricopeptide (TPR) repeat protein